MKKKYIVSLIVVGLLLLITLAIGTGYGVYLSTSENEKINSETLDCFKIYFSDNESINMTNIKPVLNEIGLENSPKTLTINNICDTEKKLQLRFSILESSTVETQALTIDTSGSIENKQTLYKDLKNIKPTSDSITESKLLGEVTVKPNETVRTNIKVWFDEKKDATFKVEEVLAAKIEIVDADTTKKETFAETILIANPDINAKEAPNFANASITNEGLYSTNDNGGNTYYYRGSVNNNYVSFAGTTWRIIRINSDNSVRLITDKSTTNGFYSEYNNSIDYTGLKYIYNNETINNNINTYLLDWYQQNIINMNLDKYVANQNFCNDSSSYVNNYHTFFNGYARLVVNKTPSLICNQTNADFGGTYKQKIGLITADEVALAGGLYNTNNFNYYLYNGENFFTMTPSEYYNYQAYLLGVTNGGAITSFTTNTQLGIRPVINLDSTVSVTGTGTITDPYVLEME